MKPLVTCWWGKLLGALFGLMAAGPIGLAVGFFLGNLLDRAYVRSRFSATKKTRQAFFNGLFLTMGYLAKSDGHVSQNELEMARRIMQHLSLTPEHTQTAMRLFNSGKIPGFEMEPTLAQLRDMCAHRRNLLYMFMQLQFQAAYADGALHQNKAQVLLKMATLLGFSTLEFNQLHGMYQAQNAFHAHSSYSYQSGQQGYSSQQGSARFSKVDERSNAYAVLGLKPGATQEEIKKAYRRLMNQYHPDKLAAKGLPEDMMKAATEKVQKIKAAYEFIKES
jgi:DnaJ like chaperone protein